LNDEKIISQPRLELLKMKCPVSRRAFSSLLRCRVRKRIEPNKSGFVKDRGNSGA
jgi:hypothetical protein